MFSCRALFEMSGGHEFCSQHGMIACDTAQYNTLTLFKEGDAITC